MHRRVAALLALPLLLAACGQSDAVESTPTKAVPDPAQALTHLIDAAHRGQARTIDGLLVEGSKATPSELEEGLGTFAGRTPHTLYRGGDWAVVVVSGVRSVEGTRERAAYAAALHLVGGRWRADLSGVTSVRIIGPRPGARAPRIAQVAAALEAPTPLTESGLWIDRAELVEKGGGSPTRGTIYGVPARPLARGVHVAVAYARDAAHGAAVAWLFRV